MKEIELFDGTVLEFPDETPDDVLNNVAKRETISRKGSQVKVDPTKGMSFGQKALAGAGKAFTDVGRGVRQVLQGPEGNDEMFVGTSTQGPERDKRLAEVKETRQGLQQEVDESRKLDAPLMKTGAGMAGNIVGNIAVAAPTMMVPGVNTYTGATAMGALMGAAQPTATGESRAQNAVIGGAFGLGSQAAGNLIGRAVKPVRSALNPEEARLAKEALKEGIPLDAAQMTGSKPLKIADSVLDNLPFTSGRQAADRQVQQQAFNKSVLKSIGVDSDLATPEVLNAARSKIGGEFQKISKGKVVQLGDDLVNKLADVDAAAAEVRGMLDTGHIDKLVNGALDLAAKGKIKGETAQIIRSELTKEASAAAKSGNTRLADALKSVRGAFDDSIRGGLSQEEKLAWDTARQQWGNLKVIEKTMQGASAGSAGGNVSGAGLWTALKSNNPTNFVKGKGDLNDLARIGQTFIKPQIPDSGTAQRLLAQQLLTGSLGAGVGYAGSGGDPMSAAGGAALFLGGPKLAQVLLKSGAGKSYLTNQALSPHQLALINALTRTAGISSIPSVNSSQ